MNINIKNIVRIFNMTAGFVPGIALIIVGYMNVIDIAVITGLSVVTLAFGYNVKELYLLLNAPEEETEEVKQARNPRFTNKHLMALVINAIQMSNDGWQILENTDKLIFLKSGEKTITLSKDGLIETDEYSLALKLNKVRTSARALTPPLNDDGYVPSEPHWSN